MLPIYTSYLRSWSRFRSEQIFIMTTEKNFDDALRILCYATSTQSFKSRNRDKNSNQYLSLLFGLYGGDSYKTFVEWGSMEVCARQKWQGNVLGLGRLPMFFMDKALKSFFRKLVGGRNMWKLREDFSTRKSRVFTRSTPWLSLIINANSGCSYRLEIFCKYSLAYN